jgi:hypothetical protein
MEIGLVDDYHVSFDEYQKKRNTANIKLNLFQNKAMIMLR